MSTKPENLFDSRTVERHISEGTVTREEYEAWLASLPDDGDDAEESGIVMILHPRARRPVGDASDEEEG